MELETVLVVFEVRYQVDESEMTSCVFELILEVWSSVVREDGVLEFESTYILG